MSGGRCEVHAALVNSTVTSRSDGSLRHMVPSPPSQPYCHTGAAGATVDVAGHDVVEPGQTVLGEG